MEKEAGIAQLDAARQTRNLDQVQHVVDEVSPRLLSQSPKDYAEFMALVCRTLASYDFGSPTRQHELTVRYADRVLNTVPLLDPALDLEMLGYLEHEIPPPEAAIDTGEWARDRRARTIRWLRVLRRISGDASFDYSRVPQLNVQPPPGTLLPAGVDPAHISDPSARKSYESSINQNSAYAAKYAEQYRLKKLRERYTTRAERFFERAYSRAPLNKGELEQLLNEHLADRTQVRRVLQQIPP